MIKETYKKVNCAYLDLSFAGISTGKDITSTSLIVTCYNNQCGPQNGCDFLDKGECKYRSTEANPEHFYRDWSQEVVEERQ